MGLLKMRSYQVYPGRLLEGLGWERPWKQGKEKTPYNVRGSKINPGSELLSHHEMWQYHDRWRA